jgi:hypothetical protein
MIASFGVGSDGGEQYWGSNGQYEHPGSATDRTSTFARDVPDTVAKTWVLRSSGPAHNIVKTSLGTVPPVITPLR